MRHVVVIKNIVPSKKMSQMMNIPPKHMPNFSRKIDASLLLVNKSYRGLLRLAKTKSFRQTCILYGSQISSTALGVLSSIIVTRGLGPEGYGILSFISAVISFTYLFFEFGFFSSAARLLALSKERDRDREFIGLMIVITIGIGMSFSFTLFILSFFIDSIFRSTAGDTLRIISILACVLPFQYMLERVCQGANEIYKMALANIGTKIWYVIGLLVIFHFYELNILRVLILSLTGVMITVALIIYSLKPTFCKLRETFKLVWRENKEYGLHVYYGRVVDVSTYQLDKIFISYFANTTSTGFYSIAMLLTNPMVLLSRSLSVSMFKEFAGKERIPKKIIIFNFVWLSVCLIALGLLGKLIIIIFFSNKYLPAYPLIVPLALAAFFQGMYQPYNMFLLARGKGKWMRDMAWMMAGGNFVSNIVLIPIWGAMGAAVASAVSMGFAICVYLYYYRKYVREEYR